ERDAVMVGGGRALVVVGEGATDRLLGGRGARLALRALRPVVRLRRVPVAERAELDRGTVLRDELVLGYAPHEVAHRVERQEALGVYVVLRAHGNLRNRRTRLPKNSFT